MLVIDKRSRHEAQGNLYAPGRFHNAKDRFIQTELDATDVVLLPEEQIGLRGHSNLRRYLMDIVQAVKCMGHADVCITDVDLVVTDTVVVEYLRKQSLLDRSRSKLTPEEIETHSKFLQQTHSRSTSQLVKANHPV